MTLPQGLAPTVSIHTQLHTCTHLYNLAAHTDTHTIYLLDRQTHPLSPVSACSAGLQLSRLWWSCFSMQHVWVSRGEEEETWKWVKAFRRRPQHRARSNSAVLALCRSITAFQCVRTHSHILQTPAEAKSYLGRVHTCRSDVNAPRCSSFIVKALRAGLGVPAEN